MVTSTGRPDSYFPLGAVGSGEPLFEGFQQVALEIDQMARATLRSDAAFEPEGVHAVRVATKRLRAIWQLHKPTANADLAKGAIRRLRDCARTLAERRDHHVLSALLQELAVTADAEGRGELAQAGSSLARPLAPLQAIRLDVLTALGVDSEDWLRAVRVTDVDLLEVGLRRSYAKTCDLGRAALRDREPEDLHRWRRWIKYLRYQVEPLATPGRGFIDDLHAELKQLGSTLGRRNDLLNLRKALRDSHLRAALRSIEREETILEARLPILGDTMLRLPPEDFLAAIRLDLGE